MRRIVRALLLATTIAAGALPTPATATPLYVLDTDESTYTFLHRVNPQTGQLTTIGEFPSGNVIVALAAAEENLLYAVAYNGELLRITPSPFAYTVVGDVGPNAIVGLAYGNGVLYAVEETSNTLWRINPATAETTIVGTIRLADGPLVTAGGDIVRAANGTWYLWTNNTRALYTLNVTTAVATPVPDQVVDGTWLTGLAIDYATGRLHGSAVFDEALVTLRPRSGTQKASVPLCIDCPTVHDLAFGDMASPRCSDGDRDGFFGEAGCGFLRDCDDTNAAVNPFARETCNGRDDDCNNFVDEGASKTCSDGNACTFGDSCQAGSCRAGRTRECDIYRLILRNPTCRSADGACCGRLWLFSALTVCLP